MNGVMLEVLMVFVAVAFVSVVAGGRRTEPMRRRIDDKYEALALSGTHTVPMVYIQSAVAW